MNSKQAFYAMFYILDKQYDKTKESALAQFLGDMNPFLFENAISADPAIYDDFCTLWNHNPDPKTETHALKIAREFLFQNKKMYEYDLETLLKCFDDATWSSVSRFVTNKFPL